MIDANIRKERIERLLMELEYEVTRGVMEREIVPDITFSKLMPYGHNGVATMYFRLSPVDTRGMRTGPKPQIKLVSDNEAQ